MRAAAGWYWRARPGACYAPGPEVAATRKGIGDLISAGKCDDVLKAALGTGDFAFAREVKDFAATGPLVPS